MATDRTLVDEKSIGEQSSKDIVQVEDEIDPSAERRIVRKVDIWLFPLVTFLFLLNYIDRSAVANAYVAGLAQDIGLGTGIKFNVGLSLFYVVYIVVEPLSNLILMRVGGKWLPFQVFCFGITTIGSAFMKNYSQFLAIRALLGIFEGCMLAGIAFLLSRFYRRHELGLRMGGILIFAPSISGAFGGLLAAGLLTVPSIGTVHSWRKIFLVDGIITSGIGIVAFFMMPTGPESAWFFTREERVLAARRIEIDQLGMGRQSITLKGVKQGLVNINLWLSAIGFCLITIPVVSTSLFLPTIIQELGHYSSVQSNLRSVPQYMVACVFGPLVAYASYRTRRHGLFIFGSTLLSLIGYIIFLCSQNRHVRYGATFLTYLGANAVCGIYLGWATANAAPETARAIASSVAPSIGTMGALVSSWAYLKKDAPRYIPGTILNIVATAAVPLLALGTVLYIRWENKIRDAGGRDHRLDGLTQEEILDLGSRHPDFRYLE